MTHDGCYAIKQRNHANYSDYAYFSIICVFHSLAWNLIVILIYFMNKIVLPQMPIQKALYFS